MKIEPSALLVSGIPSPLMAHFEARVLFNGRQLPNTHQAQALPFILSPGGGGVSAHILKLLFRQFVLLTLWGKGTPCTFNIANSGWHLLVC